MGSLRRQGEEGREIDTETARWNATGPNDVLRSNKIVGGDKDTDENLDGETLEGEARRWNQKKQEAALNRKELAGRQKNKEHKKIRRM